MPDIFFNKNIKPMLLTEQNKPFDNSQYLFEIKFDGMRAIIYVSNNDIVIKSRNGKVLNNLFPELLDIKKIVKGQCIFDGEIVLLDNGLPDFSKLQNRIAWYDALGKRKYDLGNALTLDEKQKIESQMAVVMSLAMVQYKFTNEEKKLCAEEIEKIMCFLRKKETWKAVKRYATKTQFIYYILARRFSFSANYLYRIIRGS